LISKSKFLPYLRLSYEEQIKQPQNVIGGRQYDSMLVSTMTNKQLIRILKRFKPSASVVVVSPDGLTAPSITASLNESGEWLIQISPSVIAKKTEVIEND